MAGWRKAWLADSELDPGTRSPGEPLPLSVGRTHDLSPSNRCHFPDCVLSSKILSGCQTCPVMLGGEVYMVRSCGRPPVDGQQGVGPSALQPRGNEFCQRPE